MSVSDKHDKSAKCSVVSKSVQKFAKKKDKISGSVVSMVSEFFNRVKNLFSVSVGVSYFSASSWYSVLLVSFRYVLVDSGSVDVG